MDRLNLTFACGRYDRTEALRTGDVTVEGIDLNYVPIDAPREIFDRMVGKREFDLSELSGSEFISMTGRGEMPIRGPSRVPVASVPARLYLHQQALSDSRTRKIWKASESASRSTPRRRQFGFAAT